MNTLTCVDKQAVVRFSTALSSYANRSAGDGVGDAAIDMLRDMLHWCNWNNEQLCNLLHDAALQYRHDMEDQFDAAATLNSELFRDTMQAVDRLP